MKEFNKPPIPSLSHLEMTIKETEGFIHIFSDREHMFGKWIASMGEEVRSVIIQSYQDELNALNALDPQSDNKDVNTIHQAFEEKRRAILKT
jgi:hypothetical protein